MDAHSATTVNSCLKQKMKLRITLAILISSMLTFLDWISISQSKQTLVLAVDTPTDTCVHLGRLISVQGQVQLRRKGWSDYHQASVGAELCAGDLLLPARGTRALVQCANLSQQNLWHVPDGITSNAVSGCRPPGEPIYTLTHPITRTRDPLAQGIPYIISPDNTWLLSDKPRLRWVAVPGATSYVVRVSGPWVNWQREVSSNSIVYPGKPPLKSVEQGYLLIIEADNGQVAKATFGLLDEQKAAKVQASAARIAKQNLTAEAKTLAVVEVYVGQGLIAEATELLEALVTKGSKTGAVYQTLGDLYAQIELFRQAEANYLKAVELAITAKDMEGQAVAAARLAQVEQLLGNSAEAAYWRKQAQQSFQALLFLQPITH